MLSCRLFFYYFYLAYIFFYFTLQAFFKSLPCKHFYLADILFLPCEGWSKLWTVSRPPAPAASPRRNPWRRWTSRCPGAPDCGRWHPGSAASRCRRPAGTEGIVAHCTNGRRWGRALIAQGSFRPQWSWRNNYANPKQKMCTNMLTFILFSLLSIIDTMCVNYSVLYIQHTALSSQNK